MRAMGHAERLDFIADGLPNILASARSFWSAAEKLVDNPREALVLEGFAEEEAAKVLILLDLVRCPPDKVEGRIGRIVKHFYSHLARLIYSKAQSWRPVNVTQLQEYVDSERQGHYLEGGISEYIMRTGLSTAGRAHFTPISSSTRMVSHNGAIRRAARARVC